MRPQRLIHAADQGYGWFPGHRTHLHHNLRQMNTAFQIMHQRTGSGFDIQHNRIRARSQFFGKNRRYYKRNGIHRSRYIPQRIQRFVRRRQMSRLSDNCHTNFTNLVNKFLFRQSRQNRNDYQCL